jgi:tRNA nucleotidyltransferase (CCA-adding enzyme)
MKAVEEYVGTLSLGDVYVVGGAVRDELLGRESKDADVDFLVAAVDMEALREALSPHGKVEDLLVAGKPVGVRLYPHERSIRALVPAGIEFAPPRREVSTGPGRHDFDIVVDPAARVEDDLYRRDFTVNAMARRIADEQVIDPFGGKNDLAQGVLRTISPHSMAEDPLRVVRGLRFVSQLGLEPDEQTTGQMREEARAVALVSGERIGGGLAADGMGELSKLLLGAEPRRALRIARDTGVLVELLPELAKAIGFNQESTYHHLTVDEHTFAVVQAAADAGRALRIRLAALFHDVGKPHVAWRGTDRRLHFYARHGRRDHAEVSAQLADAALRRLRYPNDLRERVVRIVRSHMFDIGKADAVRARRLLRRHGKGLALDLLDHKEADLTGKGEDGPRDVEELERLRAFRKVVEAELGSAHRLSDLAVDGADLIELGFIPGPELGRTLSALLDEVVEEPSLNRRETLLARAEERLTP